MIPRSRVAGHGLAGLVAPVLALGPGLAARAQSLGGGEAAAEVAWWRIAAALCLCLALAIAGGLVLKARWRGGAGASPGGAFDVAAIAGALGVGRQAAGARARLQLVETVRLSHQVDICLMRCDQTEFVLAVSPQGVVIVSSDVPADTPVSA